MRYLIANKYGQKYSFLTVFNVVSLDYWRRASNSISTFYQCNLSPQLELISCLNKIIVFKILLRLNDKYVF